MERKIFDLPKHPIKGEQRIVLEKPAPESVWYLVIDDEKAIPLVSFDPEKHTTPKDVLDVASKQQSEGWVAWFVTEGFSKCKAGD